MKFGTFCHIARQAFLIVGMCVACGPATAQDWITPDTCAVPAAAPPPPDAASLAIVAKEAAMIDNAHGRFWRITSAGAQVSYLWGTLHSSDRTILDLPAALTDQLSTARLLLLETDPVAKSRIELEERALQAGVWVAGSDPAYDKTFLDSRVQVWVAARVNAITHAPEALPRLTDAGLAALLLTDPCEDFAAGALPIQDLRLGLFAYEAGVPVRGLEDWDAFLTEISQQDRHDTARAIAEVYGAYLNPEDFAQARAAGFDAYRRGQIGEMMVGNRLYLAQFFGADKAASLTRLADAYLIDDRNSRFLRALRAPLDAGGAVVAVGAFHLPGKSGLINRLREAGYRIERVTLPGEAD